MAPSSEWLGAAPLVIAHRGASAGAPENTLEAFELAARLGADAVELDAKLTRDGQAIAFHDRTLLRITGAPGTPGGRSLSELRSLDAGLWKSDAYRGARIPTLSEIFEAVGQRLLINIELTDYWADQARLARCAADLVRRHGLERRVLFSSFQSSALVAAERYAPEVARGHLFGPTWLAYRDRIAWRRAEVQAVHPHESLVTPDRLARFHAAGRRVHVYTVLDEEQMRRLWEWGVDGLISDLPDVARRAREGR